MKTMHTDANYILFNVCKIFYVVAIWCWYYCCSLFTSSIKT